MTFYLDHAAHPPQSLVLPPLVYLAESRRRNPTARNLSLNYPSYNAISFSPNTTKNPGSREVIDPNRHTEAVLCLALAGFGIAFIAFATRVRPRMV